MNKTLSQVTQGNYFTANHTVKLPSGETMIRTVKWCGRNHLNSREFEKLAKEISLTKDKMLNLLDEKGVDVKLKWGDYVFSSGKELNMALRIVWENTAPTGKLYIPKKEYLQAIKKVIGGNINEHTVLTDETVKAIVDVGLGDTFFYIQERFKKGDKVIIVDAQYFYKEFPTLSQFKGKVVEVYSYCDGAYTFSPSLGTAITLNFIRRATPAEIAASEIKLPRINDYDGKISNDLVVYGCAKMPIEWFKDMPNTTRTITELTLSSGVKIKSDQMNKIRDYLKYNNLLK